MTRRIGADIENGSHTLASIKNIKAYIQDIRHAQQPRASVQKQMTHSVAILALSFKTGDSRNRVNHARGRELVQLLKLSQIVFLLQHIIFMGMNEHCRIFIASFYS